MFSPQTPRAAENITLQTKEWPCRDALPSPISINGAKEFLASGLSNIKCKFQGADVNGHAWMVEDLDVWGKQVGTSEVKAPTKPQIFTDCEDVSGCMKNKCLRMCFLCAAICSRNARQGSLNGLKSQCLWTCMRMGNCRLQRRCRNSWSTSKKRALFPPALSH